MIFEFAISRTSFTLKMQESDLALLLRNVDKFYPYLQKDQFREIIEKIEFVIIEKGLK